MEEEKDKCLEIVDVFIDFFSLIEEEGRFFFLGAGRVF